MPNNKMKNYKLKICKICVKIFTPNSNVQKFCSKECFNIHEKNYYRLYSTRNKEILAKRMKIYQQTHKNIINKRMKIWLKNKYKTDINFKIAHYLRTRLRSALKGNPKIETTMKLVGCSINFLKQYLQSKFQPGMSFSNYGKWHIDHIKSCCQFDLSKPGEQKKCFNYKNLQPLWAIDNQKKRKK